MRYKSTRNSKLSLLASQVIAQGISEEGGLFVPECLPQVKEKLPLWRDMDYRSLAKVVFAEFLTDFSLEELDECVEKAYAPAKFGGGEPVKLVPLPNSPGNEYLLELWHGPTCAFKDMALQILPHFLTKSMGKSAAGKTAVILVATSGDTGKAALEGFKDVPGTKIMVFYPKDGVSPMQKRQMATQEGENVGVCAIEGNFDDAQSGVKALFNDRELAEEMAAAGLQFSSANSINIGRLVPQVVYYVYAYAKLLEEDKLSENERMNVVVPTGNFGNILAAFYAKQMGVPIGKLICASNENKVLYDFFSTGKYDRNREFVLTSSPSMDILISSNLERLIYRIAGEDAKKNAALMDLLMQTGAYEITEQMREQLGDFYGNYASEEETAVRIREMYENTGYVLDTHTAVASAVYRKYVADTKDETVTLIASTASPFKFTRNVMNAIDSDYNTMSDFELVDELSRISNVDVPKAITEIRTAPVIHDNVCDKTEMKTVVKNFLGVDA